MSKPLVDTATISGWGVDADARNDPTYPMRHVEDQQTRGLSWTRPPEQQPDVEILQSIEHNRLPAVLGTSTPPSGVSGMIRRYAFRRCESDWWHWLLLMGANRINMVEGVVEDLGRGIIPNIPGEMGARAEWQHNKKGLAMKLGVGAGLSLGLRKPRRGTPPAPVPVRPITIETRETALGDNLRNQPGEVIGGQRHFLHVPVRGIARPWTGAGTGTCGY